MSLRTEEEELYICELYQAGESSSDIARKTHWHPSTIRKILTKHNIPKTNRQPVTRRFSLQELDQAAYLYCNIGLNQKDVAKVLGITKSSARRRLKRAAVTPHLQGRRAKVTYDQYIKRLNASSR